MTHIHTRTRTHTHTHTHICRGQSHYFRKFHRVLIFCVCIIYPHIVYSYLCLRQRCGRRALCIQRSLRTVKGGNSHRCCSCVFFIEFSLDIVYTLIHIGISLINIMHTHTVDFVFSSGVSVYSLSTLHLISSKH